MVECKATRLVVITNPEGLHLRAARAFVLCARRFDATIEVVKDCQRADGKSMPLQLTALGAGEGEELLLEATGCDAQQALDALVELFAANFEEEQTANSEPAVDRPGNGADSDDPAPG